MSPWRYWPICPTASNPIASSSISGVPVPNGEALPAQKEIDDMSEPSDFGTFGRFIETPVGQMSPEMRDAYDFTIGLRGLVPGPHRIWLANPESLKMNRLLSSD